MTDEERLHKNGFIPAKVEIEGVGG
jgi:hypothetical protein